MASYKIQLKDKAGNLLYPNVLSNSNYVTDQELSDALTPIYTRIEDLSDSISTLKGRVTSLEGSMSGKLSREIVQQLPTQDISTTTIYMVPKQDSDSTPGNVYTEYLYVNNKWEIIGDTSVSVEGFITESDALDLIDDALSDALVNYATINSPAFTGTPTTPDLTSGSADGAVANKKYVDGVISTLDTAIDLRWTKLSDL